MDPFMTAVFGFLPALLYAIAGAIDAWKQGKYFDYLAFIKTIVLGLVGAGLLSQSGADIVTSFVTSGVFTYFIDKFLNAIGFKKVQK